MAATLTDELTRVSVAEIEKWDEGPDGTVYVYGRCTTPEIDTDDQVVDSGWSGPALKEYLATAPTVRVQHNPQRDPAGSAVRVDVNRDGDGAHWLKAAVDEPVAQRLVKRGHLRAFSVGIARPVIERDVSGKARGGVIKGGKIVEVSLVDSPANRSCFLEIAKSAADGTCEFTGKVGGDEDVIAKALDADLTKGGDTWTDTSADMSRFGFPEDLSVTFTPADMARLMQSKIVEKHYAGLAAQAADTEKRDVSTAERRSLASEHNALPDGSYPIHNTGDLHNAAHLARTGHGNAEAARKLIARRARELGVADPLADDGDSASKGTVTETAARNASDEAVLNPAVQDAAVKEAEPEVTKDPEPEDKPKPVKKAKKKAKGPRKMPPWLKPKDGGDSDGDSGDSSCKQDHVHTEKCKTTPAEAAGLSGSHDMSCAPVPELMETPPVASMKSSPDPQSASGADEAAPMDPAPAGELEESPKPASAKAGMMQSSPEVAAILRFKRAGIDIELGRLHDLTCPAYHPEDVAKCHPFSDLAGIDVDAFQREAVKAACGPDMDRAKSLNLAWQAAHVLKAADQGQVNDFRMEAHKAFRDANPGPASAPTPGTIAPGRYSRPLITDGHSASSTGHDGPNSSPQVATSAPNAHSFDRPPLSAGHQSPSPSHMKGGAEYPGEQGRPTQLNYAVMEKEKARQALMQMHEHLSRQFPEACPMALDAPTVQPESRGVPPTVGIGKGVTGTSSYTGNTVTVLPPDDGVVRNQYGEPVQSASIKTIAPVAAVFKAPAGLGEFADAEVYKGFKKARKKLGKKVLSGKMTVDEARSRLGRQFAQKGSGEQEAVGKAAAVTPVTSTTPGAEVVYNVSGTLDPAVIKAAVAEALQAQSVPLETAAIGAFDPSPAIEAAVTKAVTPLLEKIQAQDTKLAETQRVIDAIADQPDPSTAAFSGLAFNPVRKAARPAGVLTQAEIAERTQSMMIRHTQEKYNASSDPAEREAYYGLLAKMRGVGQP